MKCSTGDVNVIPFSIYEFRGNHYSVCRSLLTYVNEMLFSLVNFCIGFG